MWLWIVILVLFVVSMIYQIPNIYAIMGNKAFDKKDMKKALRLYQKAYKIKRAQLGVKINYAVLVMRDERYDDAEKIFDEILSSPKLNTVQKNMVRQFRCMSFLKQGKVEEALKEAEDLSSQYENTELYSILGYAMILAKKPADEVLALCEKAYEYNEDNRDILDNYAIALYQVGRYEESVKICDEVIRKNRFFPESRYHKALALIELGRKNEAIEEMELLEDCDFGYMTTISDEEIDLLREKLGMEAV